MSTIEETRLKNKNAVRTTVCCAVILLWGLTYGWVPGLASVTLTHVPVLISCMLFGLRESLIFGFCFGLVSFIRCFMTPDVFAMTVLGTNSGTFGVQNVINILLLIFLPRILAALVAYLVFTLLRRLPIGKAGTFVASGVGAALGSLTNTVLFLGGFYLMCGKTLAQYAFSASFIAEPTLKALFACLVAVATSNGVIEAIIAVVVCVLSVFVLLRILHQDTDN